MGVLPDFEARAAVRKHGTGEVGGSGFARVVYFVSGSFLSKCRGGRTLKGRRADVLVPVALERFGRPLAWLRPVLWVAGAEWGGAARFVKKKHGARQRAVVGRENLVRAALEIDPRRRADHGRFLRPRAHRCQRGPADHHPAVSHRRQLRRNRHRVCPMVMANALPRRVRANMMRADPRKVARHVP